MHTGMLWFDNSSTSLEDKLQKAIAYYEAKYGRSPDLVLVHPSMLELGPVYPGGVLEMSLGDEKKINVRPYRPVLPGHIWVGIEDKETEQPPRYNDTPNQGLN